MSFRGKREILGACPRMPPVYFSVIPAVFKPESRPAPNKVLRMMDSGKELAGMTAP